VACQGYWPTCRVVLHWHSCSVSVVLVDSCHCQHKLGECLFVYIWKLLTIITVIFSLQLLLALSSLAKNVLFQGSLERSDIATLFPGLFARLIMFNVVVGYSDACFTWQLVCNCKIHVWVIAALSQLAVSFTIFISLHWSRALRACRKTWRFTDLCPCGETQIMSHIIESCPFTMLIGDLSQLHSVQDAAIAWLSNYGS